MIDVVAWSTGNVGRHAIAGIVDDPRLQLAGVFTSTPGKDGREVAELVGLDEPTGVKATTDAEALLALEPDCICHTAMADTRLMEALDDLQRFLRTGIDVVSSSPVFLQFPFALDEAMWRPVVDAAEEGGASLFVSGIDPGFANDWLPLSITGIAARIDELRCMEVLNYATYDQPTIIFEVMGFGREPDDELPLLLQPGVLTLAWGSVVHQLADALDVELDGVDEQVERVTAPETFEIDSGTIEAGTVAGLRFEVRGLVDDRPVIVLEHVTRLRDDLAPDWPQPAGEGCYRVELRGAPNLTVDLQLLGEDGDHNTAGLQTTAMRLVNAIPAVVDAAPGLLTVRDLPLVTARGRVAAGSGR